MTTLLFVHGWGFDSRIWDGVIRHLEGFECRMVNLGFRGEPEIPAVDRPLVIGHSMGFAWALGNIARPWAGAMAVNAFPRFTRDTDFPDGIQPHKLERMRSQFADNPTEVVTGFLARFGLETPDVDGLMPEPLAQALGWLAECDERGALAALDCPVHALAGAADPLIAEAMSRTGFAGHTLDILPDGGHLLPLDRPQWVAEKIASFARSLP